MKTISTEHVSNKCKNKRTKKYSWDNILIQLRKSIKTLAPKVTPEEKIEFEVIHMLIKKTLHVSSKHF